MFISYTDRGSVNAKSLWTGPFWISYFYLGSQRCYQNHSYDLSVKLLSILLNAWMLRICAKYCFRKYEKQQTHIQHRLMPKFCKTIQYTYFLCHTCFGVIFFVHRNSKKIPNLLLLFTFPLIINWWLCYCNFPLFYMGTKKRLVFILLPFWVETTLFFAFA